MVRRLLVTGANGFVGRSLCGAALSKGWQVRGAVRSLDVKNQLHSEVDTVIVDGVGPDTEWDEALEGVDTVVHLAARVHVMRETASDPLRDFRIINTDGTVHLARMAAAAGVRRFLFLSTIGVNGKATLNKPFSEQDVPQPHNAYAVSKLEAEIRLHDLSTQSGMEVIIVRPPLVYGPGNPGNFLKLLNLVSKQLPLPLESVRNNRSLIYLENLVDALITCISRPEAAGNTYLVSDGDDVSTPELIRKIAVGFGIAANLFPFPVYLLRLAGKVIGRTSAVNQLIGTLTVDSRKIRNELGWEPPFTMEQGLQKTAEWYHNQQKTMRP